MKRIAAIAALVASASLLAACGEADDGSPTSAENAQLNQIAEELDTTPDSLIAEDPALGNGEAAATGDLPVVANGAVAEPAANRQ